jgi:L-rhamnose mutarotase
VVATVALHTRVRPDAIEEYETAHRAVPPELTSAIRAAGVTRWHIWRSGVELFHVIECENYADVLAALNGLAVNEAWQARMRPLLEVAHDYSADGVATTLPLLWSLGSEDDTDAGPA